MKPIGGGLSSAMTTALNAIREIEAEAADVAHNVAAGVVRKPEEPISEIVSELARFPDLRIRAAANVRVVNSVEKLFDELGSLLLKR